MPCNLAISITKAAIEGEYLRGLLTDTLVERTLRALLNTSANPLGRLLEEEPASFDTSTGPDVFTLHHEAQGLRCRIGGYYGIDLIIAAGVVTVTTTSAQQAAPAAAWLALVQTALNRVARMALASQLAAALPNAQATSTEVAVEESGVRQMATRLTLTL